MTRFQLASGVLLLLAGALTFASSGGCGGPAGEGDSDGGGNGSGTATGMGNSGSTQANGSGMDTVGTFVTTGTSTMSGMNSTGVLGGGCAGSEYTGEKLPLAMFIMLDKSGSMNDPAGTGTKWSAVTSALTAYINAPTSAGVEVGIAFFGIEDPTCPIPGLCSNLCTTQDYANPIVPIAALPGNANALIQAINATSPLGGTPTSASLDGAITAAKNYAIAHPDRKVIDVYVTDGDPTECDTNLTTIYGIAANGFSGMPSIQTYVIGVGPSVTTLQGIAMNGGSGMPFLVDTGPNATQQFIDAMNAIQGNALTCTYTIPLPTPPDMFDPNLVNVEYTPTGGTPQIIGHVDSVAACPAGGMAWYYDNNASPTLINLCPDTCTQITMDVTGKINIVLGCGTIPA